MKLDAMEEIREGLAEYEEGVQEARKRAEQKNMFSSLVEKRLEEERYFTCGDCDVRPCVLTDFPNNYCLNKGLKLVVYNLETSKFRIIEM